MTCDDIIALMVNRMWASVFLCFRFFFLVLIAKMVNIKRLIPYEQKFFEVLHNFLKCKGILRPKTLTIAITDKPLDNNNIFFEHLLYAQYCAKCFPCIISLKPDDKPLLYLILVKTKLTLRGINC